MLSVCAEERGTSQTRTGNAAARTCLFSLRSRRGGSVVVTRLRHGVQRVGGIGSDRFQWLSDIHFWCARGTCKGRGGALSRIAATKGAEMGLLVFLLFWCAFAVAVGWVLATLEGKVNGTPPRTKNVILWSVFGGVVGWIVVVVRSNLKFASGMRADTRAQGDLARQQLMRSNSTAPTTTPLPDPPPAMTAAPVSGAPSDAPSSPAGWYPDQSGRGQRYWDGKGWADHTQP